MDPHTRSQLTAMQSGIKSCIEGLTQIEDRITAMLHADPVSHDDAEGFKGANGRLTEAAIAAINVAFEGGATVSEVASQYGITLSAASNRKKNWREEQSINYLRLHAKMTAGKSLTEKDKLLLRRRGLNNEQIVEFEELHAKGRAGVLTSQDRTRLRDLSEVAAVER